MYLRTSRSSRCLASNGALRSWPEKNRSHSFWSLKIPSSIFARSSSTALIDATPAHSA